MYWNEYKTEAENKITRKKYRYFLQSNFVGVNRLFVLTHSNAKRLTKRCFRNYDVIINGKNFNDQPIGSGTKLYIEIRKLSKGHGEDYTAGCSLDYEYIKKIVID